MFIWMNINVAFIPFPINTSHDDFFLRILQTTELSLDTMGGIDLYTV